jgi:hypothetical protein
MAEPLVPGPIRLEVEIAIAKLKKYKSPGSDQIPTELIQAGGEFTKKSDKTDYNNYRVISLLSTSYKMLSNILLSRLSLYVDDIIGDYQCGFRRTRSTTDQIFCIHQILEKKWEYNESTSAIHRLQESL